MKISERDHLIEWLMGDFIGKFEYLRSGRILEHMLIHCFSRLLSFNGNPEDSMPTLLEFSKRSHNHQLSLILIDLLKKRNPEIEFLKVIATLHLHNDMGIFIFLFLFFSLYFFLF
jgi:hypothetical protein